MKGRFTVGVVGLMVLLMTVMSVSGVAAAEKKYPSHAVTLVCAFPPGGVGDILNRIWGKYLEKYLGVTVMPDSKPGGGGVVATSYLVNARPDGYTLGNLGDFMLAGVLMGRATYKMDEIRFIAEVARNGCVIVVPQDSPIKTIYDLVKEAKKKPGIKYGHPGIATVIYMRMAALNKHEGLKMVGVPLKGDMEVITSVMGKHVPLGVCSAFAAMPQVAAKKLRILFCFDKPSDIGIDPKIPDLVTVFGKGVPDLTVSTYLVAPAKTPKEVIDVLEKAMAKVAADPEFVAELKRNYTATRYVPGKTVMEKDIPAKIPVLKAIMKDAGLIK